MTLGYGVNSPQENLQPMEFSRRPLEADDVYIKILWSGVCHSDKHHVRNDWGDSKYPLIPGHEIIGVVEDLGKNVTKFQLGDYVAVGNMVDSCKHCEACANGDEQYCANEGPTWTYNSNERMINGKRELLPVGDPTYGGYSTDIISNQEFVLRVPESLDPSRSAPLLCAGITVYFPFKHWRIGKGHKVGIAGIGGLGHLAVKIAKALGAEVIALTTSSSKMEDCKRLGADDALLMPREYKEHEGTFDFILSTIPVSHDIRPYLKLVKSKTGKLHIVGNMNEYPQLKGMDFVFYGKNITSSNVGGIKDTQECLEFCAEHGIMADVEIIFMEDINRAFDLVVAKKVRYRFVIDMDSENSE